MDCTCLAVKVKKISVNKSLMAASLNQNPQQKVTHLGISELQYVRGGFLCLKYDNFAS